MDCPWHVNGTLSYLSITPEAPSELQQTRDQPSLMTKVIDILPSQEELEQVSAQQFEAQVAFMAALDMDLVLKATTVAPHKLRE